jgi:thiol-disulfide isomerase/thioredoxin
MIDWPKTFAEALPYGTFLDRYASASQRGRWDAMRRQFTLTAEQQSLLGGFSRRMPVLCLAGAWCGDCINQCPVFDHFAQATKMIDLRFLDRDARPEVRAELSVNGGQRVPVVVFLSEDGYEVSRYGDRTLSTYRRMAIDYLGDSCPTGLVAPPAATLAAVAVDWLAEFERAQLILRLSPRLRAMHGD